MSKKTIKINEEKCTGCGLCVSACHEGVIGLVDGKAKLLHVEHCDGLGRCLPQCPAQAISFEDEEGATVQVEDNPTAKATGSFKQWPLKIKLVVPNAPFFDGADLLIAADCSAFAGSNFHDDWMKDKVTIIGCPKLDDGDYSKKLTAIFKQNDIKSVTVVRMEVPCCGGIESSVKAALGNCGKLISCRVATLSVEGEVESVV
jgi:ferredoxin